MIRISRFRSVKDTKAQVVFIEEFSQRKSTKWSGCHREQNPICRVDFTILFLHIYKSEVRNPSKQNPPVLQASRLECLLITGEIDHGQQQACCQFLLGRSQNLPTSWPSRVWLLPCVIIDHLVAQLGITPLLIHQLVGKNNIYEPASRKGRVE